MRTISAGMASTNPVPMGDLLTQQARSDPGRAALTRGERSLTRGELEARANRRARAFLSLGVGHDDLVAVSLRDSFEIHESAFAAWKIGATPASIPHKLAAPEFDAVLRLMNPRLLVGGGAAGSVDLATLPEGYAPDGSLSSEPLFLPPGRYWKAMTTGGSTGRPKVIVHHRPPVLDPFSPSNGLALNDVVLMPAPLYHNAPFSLTHMALCWGAHVVETDQFDPLETLRLIEKHRVKWLYLVPTMMHRIWSLPGSQRESFDLSSLEIVLHMAAPCAAWLKQAWIDWLGAERIWEMYAGTEGLGTTAISGAEWLAHKGSVGRCINGRVRVLDDLGGDRPPGEVGEVYFVPPGGRGSTYHYVGAEAKAHGDWESYGDLGWLDEQGYLYLADRRTDMILTGGANIYPAEIEAALDAHPAVASSVCVGLPDPDLGQRAHAILELKPGGGVPAPAELAKFLAGRIARFKIPYSFEVASEPLRDDAGKVRRSALRDSRARQAEKGLHFLPLRDAGVHVDA